MRRRLPVVGPSPSRLDLCIIEGSIIASKQTPSEDRNLANVQFKDLNTDFYRRSPRDYFDLRIRALMLVSSSEQGIRDVARSGIDLGLFSLRDVDSDNPPDDEALRDFVSVEAMAIQQHACEAFLRLFLAHREIPECPWLEIARLRNFTVFHAAVDELSAETEDPKLISELRTVFRGFDDRSLAAERFPGLEWDADGDALLRLFRDVIDQYQGHRTAYNATKHGLAVIPSALGINLGTVDESIIERSGPSLTWLETKETPGLAGKRWQRTTRWIAADAFLSFTVLIMLQLDSLWGVARRRYLDQPGPKSYGVSAESLDVVDRIRRGKSEMSISEFGQQLLYWSAIE